MSSTASIVVLLAEPDDAPAIASLLAEAFAEYRPLYTPEGYAATSITPKEVIRRLEEGPSDLFGTPLFTMEKILD